MGARSLRALPLGALLLLGGLLAALPAEADLTEQEQRGKAIYFEGKSSSGGEITAILGEGGAEFPASVLPCAGCHGRDGRGLPEGGIQPSDLRWAALTKPYGIEHPSGRRHPPYDLRSLQQAIAKGIDPAGNRLHVAMPRYRLFPEDMGDLIAYLRRLGEDPDPGLSEAVLTLATILPREGPQASLGAAMEAALKATFADLNRQGGLYHRRLELQVEAAPREATARAQALRKLLARDQIFALLGVFLPGAEAEVTALVEKLEIPLVGPFTLYPQISLEVPNRWVFYLLPGIDDLGRALATFAASPSQEEPPRAAILADSDPGLEAAASAIASQAAAQGWPTVRRVSTAATKPDLEALRGRTDGSGVDTVFLLTSHDGQEAFLRRAGKLGWYPRILIPGPLLSPGVFQAPQGFAGRIFAAFPTSPSNPDPRGLQEYQRLAETYGLPTQHRTAQLTALASARVLIEGLRKAGRDLSRGRLIDALESLEEFDTGLTPPVTYSPNRRIGVRGAYVLAVDLEHQTLVPASGWIELR